MRTVFVIDDDGLMREVLSRLLERRDYRVRAFQSPCHALPLIDSDYPDAVVSDVQMPEMTGLELARRLRERAARTPVILMTGAASPGVTDEAAKLGVSELFEKPIKDMDRFVTAIDRAISKRESEERDAGLDRLRMSFLTGLAHELRTPLTAIKLALENLYACHTADGASTQGRLLAISQRNIDRIVRLVEGQLDLLQITLGDVSVARRMVSVRELLERAVAETQPRVRKRVVIEPAGDEECPFLFTDPDRLRAVIRYLLEAAACDAEHPLTVRYAADDDRRQIRLHFRNVCCPAIRSAQDAPAAAPRIPGGAVVDAFETRAFHRIVASLGGEIRGGGEEANGGGGMDGDVALLLPMSPRFDNREDFDTPIGCLREAAMLGGRTISLVKCAVDHRARAGSCFSADEREFFKRCLSALSEGDALVRGRPDGTYYLGLVERRAEEIDHIADFLRAPGASGRAVAVEIETDVSANTRLDAAASGCVCEEDRSAAGAELETVGQGAVPGIS